MVDPLWNILYWGSKWSLHTVWWGAVGCEWGQPLFSLGLLMFGLSQRDFLSLLWSPSTNIEIFSFCQKYHLKNIYRIFKIIQDGLKFEWFLRKKYRLSRELLPFEVFFSCLCDVLLGVTYANMLVATYWPLKRAPHLTSPHLNCLGLYGMEGWKLIVAICAMHNTCYLKDLENSVFILQRQQKSRILASPYQYIRTERDTRCWIYWTLISAEFYWGRWGYCLSIVNHLWRTNLKATEVLFVWCRCMIYFQYYAMTLLHIHSPKRRLYNLASCMKVVLHKQKPTHLHIL